MIFVRRARTKAALAMETQGINALDVHGNSKKARSSFGRRRDRGRRRPPPWALGSGRGQRKSAGQQPGTEKKERRRREAGGGEQRRLGGDSVRRESQGDADREATLLEEELRGPLDTAQARASRKETVRKLVAQEVERRE